ncbi:glycosyl hydrolase family 95 catalytic domain-containing protein [Parabacteroides faecis]|uniref:glycosyl hydrolase family 95 catalytic domain-containing protein n=1 Tax=Parabacteroides faecis TaxID=1217282 RepID=UPI0035218519
MRKNSNLLMALGLSALSVFLFSCNDLSDSEQQSEAIIRKHTIRFTEPPKRIPNRNSVDAPLLGNGFTGVALAGPPEAQTFYVARNDFWRLKSALDESYPLVLGKIELSMPALKGASYLVEQQLYDATTTARFTKGGLSVSYKTYISAEEDLLVLELEMNGEDSVEGYVNLSLPGEKETINNPPLERVFPDEREVGVTKEGVFYLWRAFEDSVDIPTKAAMALRMGQSSDGSFVLKPGKPVRLVCAFSSNFKSNDCVADVIKRVEDCSFTHLNEIEKHHQEWWKDYWQKSFVSIPDSVIEKQYYLSLYGMASCSRDKDFPPSIFGTWITRERPNWNGDYHLNYNHMAPYYGLYSSNRIEQADPYYMPMLAQIARGNYYSEKVTGISDGILLPVGAGPLGIETTRRSPFMDTYFKGWINGKLVEDEGFFMGQKSNSSYAVVNMSMQFYRTWDKEYTRKVYPFVKGVAAFWEKYLTLEGDRYVIYNDAIHEGTVGTMNPILSLGLVRMVMQTVSDMSSFLGVDEDKREQWAFIKDHMSDYPLQERNGKTVFRYTEKGTDWWGDNTLGIQHIYPVGQIGLNSDPQLLQIAHNTVDEMRRWSDFNGTNSFFPAAVRIGYDPDSILVHLNAYSRHTYPNGFQLDNPHGIENWSTVPNTINEMLCMGHQDIVRVFPVWPREKDASFHQIRVEGAFLVSAELKNKEVTSLTIVSEQGRPLTLLNPWKQKKVRMEVRKSGQLLDEKELEDDVFHLETLPGTSYLFVVND